MEKLPVPIPPDAMVGPGAEAVTRVAVGLLADAEAKRLVTTSFNLTKEESASIDVVVGHPKTAYEHRGDFLRHAVIELLDAWQQAGFPSEFVKDSVAHIKAMRNAAYRLQLRQEFSSVLSTYEISLSAGVETGDWLLVKDTLSTLQGFVDRTPDKFWREHMRKAIAKNASVQFAINSMYEAGRQDGELNKEAAHWQHWLESLSA